MKRKKTDWSKVPWTPFVQTPLPTEGLVAAGNRLDPPYAMVMNSRYQVTIYLMKGEPYGQIAHLSFKTHDRQAYHDWRDMQRLKNEVIGAEYDAVEIYPAEDKLVDGANQYHLWVFLDYKLPFGFHSRMVADGELNGSKQRPWAKEDRPADAMDTEQYRAYVQEHQQKAKER